MAGWTVPHEVAGEGQYLVPRREFCRAERLAAEAVIELISTRALS